MLTSYELCWNPRLGTWDVKVASAWNAGGENEFGACLDPDLAGPGDKPEVDVDTPGGAGLELQKILLSISTNSKELLADKSGLFVVVDRPDVVINAIDQ